MGTAIHLGSHGEETGKILADDGNWMYTSEFLNRRQAAVGNGVPPINVGLLDGCKVGQSETPKAFLHPSNPPPEARAIVAFNVDVDERLSVLYGEAFWDALQSKKTVGQAVQALIAAYNSHGVFEGADQLEPSEVSIEGDSKTRLIGVCWPGPIVNVAMREAVVRMEAEW
jgi:hypothetical protein